MEPNPRKRENDDEDRDTGGRQGGRDAGEGIRRTEQGGHRGKKDDKKDKMDKR